MKAVLFDMDGTLLPMDLNHFVRRYFDALGAHFVPFGYDPKKLIAAVWKCTDAMVVNDGTLLNEQVFWNGMANEYGDGILNDIRMFDEFYETDFKRLQEVCGFSADAAKTVKRLKAAGARLVLASNPVFPYEGQAERLRWSGNDPADFELITTYSNAHYCKPNVGYFKEIADALGLAPSDCLMVGNDVSDDGAAIAAGMELFLLTDNLINKNGADISAIPHGGYKELNAYLEQKGLM